VSGCRSVLKFDHPRASLLREELASGNQDGYSKKPNHKGAATFGIVGKNRHGVAVALNLAERLGAIGESQPDPFNRQVACVRNFPFNHPRAHRVLGQISATAAETSVVVPEWPVGIVFRSE